MNFTPLTTFLETLPGKGVPGLDCAVYQSGKEIYRHRTGYANLETKTPIQADTLYRIYSMSKIITCAAALRFYEQGVYLLTDPLSDYLPAFKNVTIRRVLPNGGFREEPCHRPIRVQDLFTMSSGYSYNLPPEAMKQRTEMPSTRAFADFLATIPLHFEPGSHWHYGFSHDILGALIEELSGKTFGEYLKENIFAPLGMEDTGFRIPKEKASRLAACYEADLASGQYKKMPEDDYFNTELAFESGGAGILSTIDDYAKFATALCNGGTAANGYRILSRQTVDLMRTNHLDDARMKDFADPANGWGYGLGVRCLLDTAAAGSNGHPGAFGWSGLAGTDCHIDPAAELVILYAQQMMPNLETYTHNRIRNIVYAAL